jgi:hypothetical protein
MLMSKAATGEIDAARWREARRVEDLFQPIESFERRETRMAFDVPVDKPPNNSRQSAARVRVSLG